MIVHDVLTLLMLHTASHYFFRCGSTSWPPHGVTQAFSLSPLICQGCMTFMLWRYSICITLRLFLFQTAHLSHSLCRLLLFSLTHLWFSSSVFLFAIDVLEHEFLTNIDFFPEMSASFSQSVATSSSDQDPTGVDIQTTINGRVKKSGNGVRLTVSPPSPPPPSLAT